MVAASEREAVAFSLSPGNAGDGPQGRKLLATLGNTAREVYLLMDKAYEGDATRSLAIKMGYTPVVPPKSNRKIPWEYDKTLYILLIKLNVFFAESSVFGVSLPAMTSWISCSSLLSFLRSFLIPCINVNRP